MPNEPNPIDVKSIWCGQRTEETHVTLENIRLRASEFQKRAGARMRREYVACALVVLAMGYYCWVLPGWMLKVGSALIIIATAFVAAQLHRRTAPHSFPAVGEIVLAEFHRRELVRLRDAARSVWRWYIAPFVPGMSLMIIGRALQFPAGSRQIVVLCGIIVAFVFGILWIMSERGAERLQRRIDELDRLLAH